MRNSYVLCVLIAMAGFLLSPSGAMASPADEIRAAVLAGGAPSVKDATQKQFTAALASLMAGKPCRKVREYAAAAVKLRPDLAESIVKVAIAAVTRPGHKPDDNCVAEIAAAMVEADPSLASDIAAWATADDPDAAGAIVAAINALPGGSGGFVFPASNGGYNSPSGTGTINPSNLTGTSTTPTKP